jgi:hydrogenase maturation protein HypF
MSTLAARRWLLTGRVQGVGFRPFVYRLAHEHALTGWVQNRRGEVEVLAQGAPSALDAFARALIDRAPPLAQPKIFATVAANPEPLPDFRIRDSAASTAAQVHVPPDYFACDDCLRELADPRDRRHRYPFINCTQCGPRYTLIERLPYDRANTTMRAFPLCPACEREYRDPRDRRFHAEPIACPVCGPQLQFASDDDGVIDDTPAALAAAAGALRAGRVIAVKGIGGYHLLCDAGNDRAVERLRVLKPRPHKPLAVMFPLRGADGLDALRAVTVLSPAQARALTEPARPIVMVAKPRDTSLSAALAPGLAELGVLLPYSPLHQLLLADLDRPLVATSANVSGEPVLTDNVEAERRLAHVADAFLHHDRPIARPADDSVVREIAGRVRPLRLGRGLAPLELQLPGRLASPLLAVGGHLKNSVALAWADRVVLSPHIGELDAPRSLAVFEQVIDTVQTLYEVHAERIVCDAHPDYTSTRWARRTGLPVQTVFHHYAHASALAGEHPEVARWLTFAWDGVGLGADGTLWGGEALLGNPGHWQRVASFRTFRLPGGDKAGREPWRAALALCWESGTDWPEAPTTPDLLRTAWERGLNAPASSAVGRLFDAAAAFTGLCARASFEGQGPMWLEASATGTAAGMPLPLAADAAGLWRSDWAPLLPALRDRQTSAGERAMLLHATLARAALDQALKLRAQHGEFTVGLTGGVFQNRLLTEQLQALLAGHGFEVRLVERVPGNDAGLAFGQVIEALAAPPI